MKRRKIGGRRKAIGGRRRIRRGGSAFTDFFTKSIPHFFTKTIPRTATTVYERGLRPAGNFIKDNKLLSKGLSLIPHPAGKIAGTVASAIGAGRRRRRVKRGGRRRVRRGRGPLLNMMGDLIRGTRYVARKLGYGRKRKVGSGRRRMGGASSLNGRLYLV
jgi:hypothetical protein